MPEFNTPQDALRHHVSGAVERGEKEPIVEQRAAVDEHIEQAFITISVPVDVRVDLVAYAKAYGLAFATVGPDGTALRKDAETHLRTVVYEAANDAVKRLGVDATAG